MANSKGKSRRVDNSDGDEEVPASRTEMDDEDGATRKRTRDKGKGRAAPSNSNGSPDVHEVGVSDQDEPNGGAAEADENQEEDRDLNDIDTEQDINEKRSIRKKYRHLTQDLNANRDRDPNAITAGALKAGLVEVNKLFKGVQAPAEAILDSDYLRLTSEMAMYQARKMKIGSDYFDTDDFITKLKSAITGNLVRQANRTLGSQGPGIDENQDCDTIPDPYVGWDRIGKLATKHCLRVPPIDFMLGPLAIPQKKKIQKKRQAREKFDPAETVRPKEIGEDDIQHDENAAPTLVKHVADVLEEQGGQTGINLFKFLINPESYTQTVENIFYTSFLIKDRRAAIDYDDNDEPYIYASLPPDEEQRADADLKARQLIFEMDMQMWKDAIEAYDIKKTAIPTRKYASVQTGKWYG